MHNHNVSNEFNEDAEDLEKENKEKAVPKTENLLLNWPLMSSIVVYCFFSVHDMAYTEVYLLLKYKIVVCISNNILFGISFFNIL